MEQSDALIIVKNVLFTFPVASKALRLLAGTLS
jgi:hypothetical protein